MRLVLFALSLTFLAGGSAQAVDYDRIDRRLVKEPSYASKSPAYALLLFGVEAKLRVWVVLDGETLYIDRNGNGDLTEAGERFASEKDCKDVDIADPDGKTKYLITRVATDVTTYTRAARKKRAAEGVPPEMMVYVTITGPVAYRQYADVTQMRTDPAKAMLAHFHGPLTIGSLTINWKVPDSFSLRTGEKPSKVMSVIGTMNAQHGCWVVVQTTDGDICTFPDGVRPTVEIEFPPKKPGGPPVKQTYDLAGFC